MPKYDDYEFENAHQKFEKAKVKNDTTLLIQKQFALRKSQAIKELEMQPSTQISKVKSAQYTSTKVNGLTTKIRESNLLLFANSLKENAVYLKDKESLSKLKFKHYEDIATNIEYECFSSSKAVSLYRRNIAHKVNYIIM